MVKGWDALLQSIRSSQCPYNPRAILKERLLLILIIFGSCLLLSILPMGCPLKYITGISCPGCGMTRAFLSLFLPDVSLAFHYHPLFILLPVMACLYLFGFYLNPKLLRALWLLLIIIFLLTYLVRLYFIPNDVVEIDLQSGFILKLYHFLLACF